MAASVLAIGPAQSLPPAGDAASPDAAIVKVQQKEMSPGPGSRGPGQGGPSVGGPGQGGPGMGGPGTGGGKMRGEGPQFRSGDKGLGYGPRMGERGRVWIGPERQRGHMRRHYGRRGWEGGPGYGFRPADCGWLRRRALSTGSRYWWRQYRDCLH
jgi:hypothetical protein